MTSIHNATATAPVQTTALGAPSANAAATDAGRLLPEPNVGNLCDDAYAELAMLLTRADESDRKQARSLEQQADQAASAADAQRVQQMRDKADAEGLQGLVGGLAEMAEGGTTLAGSLLFKADTAARVEASGKLLKGVGDAGAAGYAAAGARDSATAAQFEAQSQAEIRRYGEMHDRAAAANDSMQKVEQFLAQIEQTANATRLAAATRA